ncbi:hypothetical protein D3C81_1293300 [compost metagenome]
MIAEGIAALTHHVESIGQAPLFIQRAGGVQGAALHALIIQLTAQRDRALGQRLLGHNVEGAAGIATAVEHRRRPAQNFQTLDGVGIGHVRVAAIDREAVAVELAGGETAHGERRQALPAKIVRPAHTTGIIQRILQTRGAEVFDSILGDHADRLRGFMDRGVGTGGTGRTCGAVTLHRAVSPFVIRCTDHVGRLQL